MINIEKDWQRILEDNLPKKGQSEFPKECFMYYWHELDEFREDPFWQFYASLRFYFNSLNSEDKINPQLLELFFCLMTSTLCIYDPNPSIVREIREERLKENEKTSHDVITFISRIIALFRGHMCNINFTEESMNYEDDLECPYLPLDKYSGF